MLNQGYSDTMGVTLTKSTPKLFNCSLKYYEDAIEWVKAFLAERGYYVTRATLDPYVEVWFLYERDGTLITALDNAIIEDIMEGFFNAGHSRNDARIQSRDSTQWQQDRPESEKPQTGHRDSHERGTTGEEGQN